MLGLVVFLYLGIVVYEYDCWQWVFGIRVFCNLDGQVSIVVGVDVLQVYCGYLFGFYVVVYWVDGLLVFFVFGWFGLEEVELVGVVVVVGVQQGYYVWCVVVVVVEQVDVVGEEVVGVFLQGFYCVVELDCCLVVDEQVYVECVVGFVGDELVVEVEVWCFDQWFGFGCVVFEVVVCQYVVVFGVFVV